MAPLIGHATALFSDLYNSDRYGILEYGAIFGRRPCCAPGAAGRGWFEVYFILV
jgi:hypothetical protein